MVQVRVGEFEPLWLRAVEVVDCGRTANVSVGTQAIHLFVLEVSEFLLPLLLQGTPGALQGTPGPEVLRAVAPLWEQEVAPALLRHLAKMVRPVLGDLRDLRVRCLTSGCVVVPAAGSGG